MNVHLAYTDTATPYIGTPSNYRVTSGSATPQSPLHQRASIRMRAACIFAENHLDEPLKLRRVAAVAGFEPTYFSRLFSTWMGIGYSHWLHYLRLGYAKSLLRHTSLSVLDVASAVGYGELSTFERNFSRYVGIRPREFRSENLRFPIAMSEALPVTLTGY